MRHPRWSKHTRVFMDTCSLMGEASRKFMESHLVPIAMLHKAKIIVPRRVIDELVRLSKHHKKATARSAKLALHLVRELIDKDAIDIMGEKDDSFADNLFQAVFTRYRLKYRLILITQDRNLVKDILYLNQGSSVDGIHGINAYRIGDRGDPMQWSLEPSHPSGVQYQLPNPDDGFSIVARPAQNLTASTLSADHSVLPFTHRSRVSDLNKTPVKVTFVPVEGDVVTDSAGNHFHLTKTIGKGGEGTAYETAQGLVCKIYHKDHIQNFMIEKLKLMTSRKVDHPAICWPISLAFNSYGEPVGYLMPKAQGKELKRTIFIKPLLQQAFPHWTRQQLVQLASSIVDAMAYLHSINVLLGDINAANILVKDESTVFFVDCDSYQVEGFPSPVSMPPFLAPELYDQNLSSCLRTIESEYFSIATLVFMLLHPGKSPYSHQGGEDPSKNVRKQHFPYPDGQQRGQGVPGGPWRFMWSHLPRYMKDNFHAVFSHGQRLTVNDWQTQLQKYQSDMKKGWVCDDAFPKGFKRLNQIQVEKYKGTWKICSECGQGFGVFNKNYVICSECYQRQQALNEVPPTSSQKPNAVDTVINLLNKFF